ncbi:SWI/SNF complex subunit SWI3A homolog [Phragmites australis]|uniref:SWI/SNF complex subunit SWI3A homolog n=1 Tax=Phragmites australis TaxID=29695 RepID=UPI002D769E27|nr:SWI/SNF complex subunit SWI3A homolog [Phragmites australis]
MSPPAAGATATSGEAPPSPRELYTIPASSGWFRWDGIHETERQALPEFFGGAGGAGFGTATRNPRIYREYRDFIIGKYREDPARRLTFTEVRRALVGDVTLLQKLFAFLDASGLINFSVTPSSSRPAGQQQEAGVVVEAPVGLQVTPRPPASYFAEEKRGGGGENGFRLPPLTSYNDVFGEWAPGKAPICGFCGEECKDREFETLEDGFKVCSKCSKTNNDNKEEATKCPGDKKESVDNHASSAWTEAETLLLLEGVLKHGDDWDLIAQHVRTKNKSECIARLIQLPFGEHMLGTINGKSVSRLHMNQTTDGKMNQHIMNESSSQSIEMVDGMQIDGKEDSADKSAEEHPAKCRRLFSSMDATTSLMEQLALLTTATSPDVLAAAADAAIKALGNENPQARKAFRLSEREYKNKAFSSNHVQQIDCKGCDQDTEMQGQTVTDKKQEKKFIATAYQVRAAVATAIGVAAARAKILADQEEREMELLLASIIETQLRKIQYKIKHFDELELIMEQEYTTIQQIKGSLVNEWLKVLGQAFQAGVSLPRDEVLTKLFLNKETGHELPEREKEAYARSRACRLALIDHAVARKKPPLNAFKPHPEHKSKLVCNITGDTINKSEEHIWKHINGKRFLNKLEQLEEKMASGEMAEGEAAKSNEVAKKSKSSKKDKKKATVVSLSLPREPKPEMDDSDDPDFWVPPVGSRWDDDDGKDRWESSPGKNDAAENEGASGDGGSGGGDDDDEMADKDDAESRELASSRTKRMTLEAVGPSSFASRKKKPKKDQ